MTLKSAESGIDFAHCQRVLRNASVTLKYCVPIEVTRGPSWARRGRSQCCHKDGTFSRVSCFAGRAPQRVGHSMFWNLKTQRNGMSTRCRRREVAREWVCMCCRSHGSYGFACFQSNATVVVDNALDTMTMECAARSVVRAPNEPSKAKTPRSW